MLYDLALIMFLAILLLITIIIFKRLNPGEDHPKPTIIDSPPATVDSAPLPTYSEPTYLRKNKQSIFVPLFGIAIVAYLLIQNQEIIAQKIAQGNNQPVTETSHKEAISPATIDGHAIVDGVNWFKIVATSTTGLPFTGWVSEMAIHKEPPQENRAADSLMQKLGLPTNKERIESIKSLKKVGNALQQSLRDVKPQSP